MSISIANAYYFGYDNLEQNINLAIQHYEQAAGVGSVEAMYTLAYIYLRNGSVFSSSENDNPKIYDIDKYNLWYNKAEKNRHLLNDVNEVCLGLGNMYYFGTHGIQDYDLSIKYYEKSANQGNVLSMYTLGVIYYWIKKDISNARKWCQMKNDISCIVLLINMGNKDYDMIDSENKHIQHAIGKLFHSEKKYDKSMEWSIKAGVQGHSDAQNRSGYMYLMKKNYKKAFEWFTMAAEQEHAVAINNLGSMYLNGQGVEKDYDKAFKLFTKASQYGVRMAMHNLAIMYENGQGTKVDYNMTVKLLEKAANFGNWNSYNYLGVMYFQGRGVERNYDKAFELYAIAADKGVALGNHNLATMYEKGHGVKIDYEMAARFYEKAAILGHANSYNYLGFMYFQGRGVEKNYNKAFELFAKGNNDGKGKYSLAKMYENEKDYDKAIKLYQEAFKEGIFTAQNDIKRIRDPPDYERLYAHMSAGDTEV